VVAAFCRTARRADRNGARAVAGEGRSPLVAGPAYARATALEPERTDPGHRDRGVDRRACCTARAAHGPAFPDGCSDRDRAAHRKRLYGRSRPLAGRRAAVVGTAGAT